MSDITNVHDERRVGEIPPRRRATTTTTTTTTTAAPLLLLPLVILQHLLVHPPELNMPSCALRLCPALLTLDPFLLLVAISITIALLLLDISLRVHVTESGGLHARRPHTDLAPHVLYRTVRNAFHLSVTRA